MKIHIVKFRHKGHLCKKGFANIKDAKSFRSRLRRGLIEGHSEKEKLVINSKIKSVDFPISSKGLVNAMNY